MTEVLRGSFQRHLPRVLSAIKRAEFVAVDLEFTGIARHARQAPGTDHTVMEYRRAVRTAQQFAVAQVGVSCFRVRDPEAAGTGGGSAGVAGGATASVAPHDFEAETFNFFIAPPRASTFTCSSDALAFLSSHSFDFNKFVAHGVEFESRLQRQHMVGRWSCEVAPDVAMQMADDCAGFARVVDELWRRRVPLVGHNMLLDLTLLLQHFHEPVPASYTAFSKLVAGLFASVWDTKHVARVLRRTHPDYGGLGSGLGSLFRQCSFDTQRVLSPLCVKYKHTPDSASAGSSTGVGDADATTTAVAFPHEAGYDAYMTGCVLLDLASKLDGSGDLLSFLRTPPAAIVNHIAIPDAGKALPVSRRDTPRRRGSQQRPPRSPAAPTYTAPRRQVRTSPLSATSVSAGTPATGRGVRAPHANTAATTLAPSSIRVGRDARTVTAEQEW